MKEDVLETIYSHLLTIASKKYRDFIREVTRVGSKIWRDREVIE